MSTATYTYLTIWWDGTTHVYVSEDHRFPAKARHQKLMVRITNHHLISDKRDRFYVGHRDKPSWVREPDPDLWLCISPFSSWDDFEAWKVANL